MHSNSCSIFAGAPVETLHATSLPAINHDSLKSIPQNSFFIAKCGKLNRNIAKCTRTDVAGGIRTDVACNVSTSAIFYIAKSMNDKFRGIYRIPTARAPWWDYSHSGLYFVTICTYGMECCLGFIENNEMHLSDIGKAAEMCWIEIPKHFPFVKLHAWTIMPNHVHGIVEILPDERRGILPGERVEILPGERVEILPDAHVQTLHATSLQASAPHAKILPGEFAETLHATSVPASPAKNLKMASISPPKGSLGSIVRSYKSAVSKQAPISHPQFGWHERYYDSIIKDVPAYQRIETYIRNNVRNWETDILFG